MSLKYLQNRFSIIRNMDKCISCKVCINQCANNVHSFNTYFNTVISDSSKCVNCQRCVLLCPTNALSIYKNSQTDEICRIYSLCDNIPYFYSKKTPSMIDKIEINIYNLFKYKPQETDTSVIINGSLKIDSPFLISHTKNYVSLNAYRSMSIAAEKSNTLYFIPFENYCDNLQKYLNNAILQIKTCDINSYIHIIPYCSAAVICQNEFIPDSDKIVELAKKISAVTNVPIFAKIFSTSDIIEDTLNLAMSDIKTIIIEYDIPDNIYPAGSSMLPELTISLIDKNLTETGLRKSVSIITSGNINSSDECFKVMALGANAVLLDKPVMMALGCHQCNDCKNLNCNWGISTDKVELQKRLNYNIGAIKIYNLLNNLNENLKKYLASSAALTCKKLVGQKKLLSGFNLSDNEISALQIPYIGLWEAKKK